jgi:hypothetical protein
LIATAAPKPRGGIRAAAIAALLCLLAPWSLGQSLDIGTPPAAPAITAVDTAGIQRDTAYFLGYQFAAVGLISLWPQSETNNSHKIGFDRWWYNVTHPHWDTDSAVVNYVLHPYWGAGYYIRARERGLSRGQSFWYSALLSSIFEYGAEAMVEQVSYQDLVVTPVLGSLLGEYVFSPLRDHILAKDAPLDTLDQLGLILTDPLGSINSAVNRMLGVETQISLGLLPQDAGQSRQFAVGGGMPPAYAKRRNWGLRLDIVW